MDVKLLRVRGTPSTRMNQITYKSLSTHVSLVIAEIRLEDRNFIPATVRLDGRNFIPAAVAPRDAMHADDLEGLHAVTVAAAAGQALAAYLRRSRCEDAPRSDETTFSMLFIRMVRYQMK